MVKILKILAVALFIIFVASVVFFLRSSFYISDVQINEQVLSKYDSCTLRYVQGNEGSQRVLVCINDPEWPFIVMIHGAPGSLGDYLGYISDIQSMDSHNLIIMDRMGYRPNDADLLPINIRKQSENLTALVQQLVREENEVIFISHSYGGPIAALSSIHLPDQIIGHIMVAPVIDPESEPIFWFARLPLLWPFSIISSHGWKRSSLEKLHHRADLATIQNEWENVKVPTIHIHGTEDWLAPIENVAYCKKYMDVEMYRHIELEERSHFILWAEDVKDLIYKEIKKL